MPTVKGIMYGMIVLVVGLSLVGTVWDTIYASGTGALRCYATNGSVMAGKDCHGQDCRAASCCIRCLNGTTETLLKLVPLIYVGAVLIGGLLLAKYG